MVSCVFLVIRVCVDINSLILLIKMVCVTD